MDRPPQFLPKSNSDTSHRRQIWDCASSLYDSVELKSFHNHLHSAIAASRNLSMPRAIPPPQKRNLPRALQKLFRSMFWKKRDYKNATFDDAGEEDEKEALVKEPPPPPKERYYYVFYDKSGSLSTIPEVPEYDVPPVRRSFVRRTASARVSAPAGVGIWR